MVVLLPVLTLACGGRSSSAPGSASPGAVAGSAGRTYAVATVEQYPNGLSIVQHPLGDSAARTLAAAGWTGDRYRDEQVVPALFVGRRSFPDLMLYAGHGTHNGPALTTDPETSLIPGNYYWGGSSTQPLRWFYNDSCIGLNDGIEHPDDPPRWAPIPGSYWHLGLWLQAMNWGNAGMHAYLAHRGFAYASRPNTGAAWAIPRSLQGESVGKAWFEAAALDMANGVPGILPAVLSAYDPASGRDYFDESLANPWPDPRVAVQAYGYPIGDHGNLAYHFARFGTPFLPNGAAPALDPETEISPALRSLPEVLVGIPHQAWSSAGANGFVLKKPGPEIDVFLALLMPHQKMGELLHFVQRGHSPVVLADRMVALRFGGGWTAVVQVTPAGRVMTILVADR